MSTQSNARVSGGSVEYSETRQIADYQPKMAKVVLNFAVPDGYSIDDSDLEKVRDMAKRHVHHALDVATTAAKGGKTKETAPLPAASSASPASSSTSAPATPASAPPPAADPTAIDGPTPAQPVGGAPAAPTSTTGASSVAATPADPLAIEADPFVGAPSEITDRMLAESLAAKNKATNGAILGNIRQLIGKYAGTGVGSAAIPAEKRQAFLAELEALKAA